MSNAAAQHRTLGRSKRKKNLGDASEEGEGGGGGRG